MRSSELSSALEAAWRELETERLAHQRAALALDQQRRINQTLERAVRARDLMLAVVAHDLRNPVSVISLTARTLLKNHEDPPTRRALERILRSLQRADHMIGNLLEMSALDSGWFALNMGSVKPAELILTAIDAQCTLARAASITVTLELAPELPDIPGDEERLMDVLENLIGNAIKFTAAGGTITVGAHHRKNEVRVWVKDSGSGIVPEQLPYIFDRFWRANMTERRGIGLGLWICKANIEAHGGRIWAESELGIGTTLAFTVPTALGRNTIPPENEIANILLLDDRTDTLLALEQILNLPGYRVVKTTSGHGALALALREPFAVALVDIAMPGMAALEVADRLRELEFNRNIPIIFVAASSDPREIHSAYSEEGVDYLVEPLDVEVVRAKVAACVELNRRQRHAATST